MENGFCVLKVFLEMSKRGVYVSTLIKINPIVLGVFMEIYLTVNMVQNILVMWDVLVVNVMRWSLIFFYEGT